MSDPWTSKEAVLSLDANSGVVTLVEESSFAVSDRTGDIIPGRAYGLFFLDCRIVSRWELRVNGARTELLAAVSENPFSAVFVSRARPGAGRSDSTLLVRRSRYMGRGMREDLRVQNFGEEPAFCTIEIFAGADFGDVFAVKEGRAEDPDGDRTTESGDSRMSFEYHRGSVSRGVRIDFGAGASVSGDLARFDVIVPPAGEWSTCFQVSPIVDGKVVEPRHLCGEPVEEASPVERLARWREQVPFVDSDHEGLRGAITRSVEDLGALRMFDPEFPDRAVVAAGAPWFMTVFGRDSLLTAWMALMLDPGLALGVVQTLARFQGEVIDPRNEEEPGRILHEMRFGESSSLNLGSGGIYYGTADATPLFVILLGELRRWGLEREKVDELLPNADRALAWIEHFGDADGDGYVEYHRSSDRGLVNQGWKDSWDGIRYADGTIARAPIALCEVQGYVYGAYLARAHFASEMGDHETYERYRAKAEVLKKNFNRDYWLEDRGWFAVGLDAQKRPIDALASNMGHCLWTGIVDEDKAASVAAHLVSEEMFSGWGIRTLGRSMGGYNPISYHCGSVWPHDTAIAVAGLSRYGFVEEAQRVALALLDAATAEAGRLPELFSGVDRADVCVPVSYPTSCSPQAWAAGSALLLLRSLLRLDPWIPHGKTWLAPQLPAMIKHLRVDNIPLAGGRVTISVEDGHTKVDGLPDGIEVILEPRNPSTAV
ncbi:MAG: amylo-alpha-1,6-glucosidase [Acidimicrobiales bacterium]